MKIGRIIWIVLCCLIIGLGLYSAVSYVLRDHQSDTTLTRPETSAPETTPAPTTETTEPESTQSEAQLKAQEMVKDLDLEDKIYQLFFASPEAITGVPNATRAGDTTKAMLELYPVGGILYAEGNIEDSAQIAEMLENTASYLGENDDLAAFFGIAVPGGNADLADKLGTTNPQPLPRELGEAGETSEANDAGSGVGRMLSRPGFNVTFAPNVDLIGSSSSDWYDLTFGEDAETVSNLTSAFVSGVQSSEVCAVLQHFPGLGSAERGEDDKYTTNETWDSMTDHLSPFTAGISAGAGFVTVSSMLAPELTGEADLPCCLSQEVMRHLREDLSFGGVILTDSLSDDAITSQYENGEAAVLAIQAGADMLLDPPNIGDAFDAISQALEDGTITEARLDESVVRILTAKLEAGILES